MGLFKNMKGSMKTGMDLLLQAMAQGGATPSVADRDAVQAQGIIAGSDLGPYAPGASYPVRIDPDDRTNVTFG
jgi:hypothetical protein